ncbi:MAG: 16S rRNA (guanine(527)-N(7))-methyltransferase RsmG [Azoarcus sp.]|jgi:16S rRNA (guanine527-N7)-methyltransferase|nr:16S rRNA (guanine(527)-N(7))-methyltransferase RsmG [Azoarcus sp.]
MSGRLSQWQDELDAGLAALGLDTANLSARLLAFGELLLKWNQVYNLTAISAPREIITRHLFDALAIWPQVDALRHLVDAGSGAGLPGLPLALACPALTVTSIETVNKKASFQQQARIELEVKNFHVLNRRIETVRPAELPNSVDGVISRAFSSLADFVRLAGHLVDENGALYAMKGMLPTDEIAALPKGWAVTAVQPLTVPGLNAERHLVVIRRANS